MGAPESVWDRLLKAVETEGKLDTKTDEEIAQIAIDHLWAHEDTNSPQAALLSNMIDRLRRAKGGVFDRHAS